MDPDITGVGDIASQNILVMACSIRMRCGLISTCLFYLALIPLTVIRAFFTNEHLCILWNKDRLW